MRDLIQRTGSDRGVGDRFDLRLVALPGLHIGDSQVEQYAQIHLGGRAVRAALLVLPGRKAVDQGLQHLAALRSLYLLCSLYRLRFRPGVFRSLLGQQTADVQSQLVGADPCLGKCLAKAFQAAPVDLGGTVLPQC